MPPTLLAMHMANELLSVPVAGMTLAVAAGAVAMAARRCERATADDRLPLMGVMGAFVFAAQMINFSLPLMPGTSGHLGGGVLLAILMGPAAGIVTMAAILIVQCLLFQDGGLLALGCNIINMGVVPCLIGGWVYRISLGSPARAAAWRQYLAAWIACVVGVCAGAAMVPIEAGMSGVLGVPTNQFLGVMIGVHLVIALGEGAITFAVIAYLRHVRPELVGVGDRPSSCPSENGTVGSTGYPRHCNDGAFCDGGNFEEQAPASPAIARHRLGYGAVTASLLATALMVAGVVSWFASTLPDGLEWSCKDYRYGAVEQIVRNDSPLVAVVDRWQGEWSLMSDYAKRESPLGTLPPAAVESRSDGGSAWGTADGWRSLAGVLGTIVTLGVLYGASQIIRRVGMAHCCET